VTDTANRLDWVDMAKGLSIFLVVMMYCAASIGEDTGQTGLLHWAIAFATPFRMPEFFLLSGLFLSAVIARPWKAFADRRIVHYLYFYALWAVIHIAFKVGLVGMNPVGALGDMALAIVQPYGVLWFIYMLAVLGLITKLVHDWRLPQWAVLVVAAILQMAPIQTGAYALDQFAEYYVYFFVGYAFAPQLFKLAQWATHNTAAALVAVLVWALANAALVFGGGFIMGPVHPIPGYASLPGLQLTLALIGSAALCLVAALLTRLPWMAWLQWMGSKSLIVYVAFVLPMGIARIILLKLGLTEPNLLSLTVLAASIISPLILWWIVQRVGFGTFLFERPAWAHLPGTYRSAASTKITAPTPAE
jgi:uncharacterized membrane protein YcfT